MIDRMNRLGSKRIPFLFMFDFDLARPVVLPLDEIDPAMIRFNFNGVANDARASAACRRDLSFSFHPIPFASYREKFDTVIRHLKEGHSYLVNLTQPTPIASNDSLRELYDRGRARYKLLYQDRFVFFSPEIFVQIRGDQIATYPMKGTRDARVEHAEQDLLSDSKEAAEHLTVVDLLRNDLGIVADAITVERYRYIERITTHRNSLLQMSSKITGHVGSGWNERVGDLIARLLPAGSVTGAPKKKTIEIIREVEGYDRGYYTGVCGIFTGSALDSCVMIRFIEQTNTGMVFKSGGGVTIYSNARSEYDEMIDKIYVPVG